MSDYFEQDFIIFLWKFMDPFSECFMSCHRNKKKYDCKYLLIYFYVIFMYLPKHVGEMEKPPVEMTAGGARLYILLTLNVVQ